MVRFANTVNMVSNPYPPHKNIAPTHTTCEICDRTIMTKDWRAHKSSKKHREVEKKIADEEKAKNEAASAGWGADYTAEPTPAMSENGCRNCGEEGHFARDCTAPKKSGGACHNCGNEGHFSKDCTEPKKSSGACHKCGEEGHFSRECPQGGGGGGSRTCRNCEQEGHIARDCPEPRVVKCRNCDAVGHVARDCTEKKDWSRVKCNNCGNMGHTVKRCPEEIKEDSGFGGGFGGASSGWGDATTTSGGWGDASGGAASTGWGDASAPVADTSSAWDTGEAPKDSAPVADDGGW